MKSAQWKMALGALSAVVCASTVNADPKFGMEYRAGLTYNDGELEKAEGSKAETSTVIALEAANILMSGEAAKNVNYAFGLDLTAADLYQGRVDFHMSDMMTFVVGKDKVNYGGWYAKDFYTEYSSVVADQSFAFAKASPLKSYEPTLGLSLALAGNLSINAYNDTKVQTTTTSAGKVEKVAGSPYKNNSDKSQAVGIEWVGNFGGWMPLVQILTYDNNNSQAFSVGVKGKLAGALLLVDYASDSRKNFSVNTNGESDMMSQIDAMVSYDFAGFTPKLSFHKFDYKQGGTDSKANSKLGGYDDNAQVIAAGVDCTALGGAYVPYIMASSVTGTYLKADTTADTESKSGMSIKAGVMGKF